MPSICMLSSLFKSSFLLLLISLFAFEFAFKFELENLFEGASGFVLAAVEPLDSQDDILY